MNFDKTRMLQLALDASVRILPTYLSLVYRGERFAALGDGTQIPYDFLVLATGRQFQSEVRAGCQEWSAGLSVCLPVCLSASVCVVEKGGEKGGGGLALRATAFFFFFHAAFPPLR